MVGRNDLITPIFQSVLYYQMLSDFSTLFSVIYGKFLFHQQNRFKIDPIG